MEHRLFLCLALIGAAPLAARQDPLADPFAGASELDRAGLVAAVLERNPGLEASRRALEAAQASAGQAAALEQPMASYAMAPASVGAGDVPFGQEIELSQPLPYPGRRRLRDRPDRPLRPGRRQPNARLQRPEGRRGDRACLRRAGPCAIAHLARAASR